MLLWSQSRGQPRIVSTQPQPDQTPSTAILVTRGTWKMALSPFFAKCDGLLMVDGQAHIRAFRANPKRTSRSTCDLIIESGATRLVCGFIAIHERDRLSAHGVDVRLGSCICPVTVLSDVFDTLPAA